MKVAAAIIAGGGAQRLGGITKGLLVVGGLRIIDRQLNALAGDFEPIVLVTNDPSAWPGLPPGLQIVGDRVPPGAGPLAGIDAALAAVSPDVAAVVCLAGDMPFITVPALRLLRDHAPDADAVVPRLPTGPEPLFARYARRLSSRVSDQLAAGDRAVHHLLDHIQVAWLDEAALRAVDPALTFLENINTPEQLARAAAAARR